MHTLTPDEVSLILQTLLDHLPLKYAPTYEKLRQLLLDKETTPWDATTATNSSPRA